MADYRKYIDALRRCAKEHANDTASMGHIIVSALLTDTANLLVRLEKIPKHILGLRKCAEEHANDITPMGCIIVSDLCKVTANLLEGLEKNYDLDKIKSEVLEYIDDLDIAEEICDVFDKYKVTEGTKMKYRKKPVVVEAYQTDRPMMIHTPEGDMTAYVGDYIITGVNGEQYPCKPDIFEKTYERVIEN